jgi:predicted DNA-binding transcriptional regulator AlpA
MRTDITREWITYKQAEELSGLSRTTLWKLVSILTVALALFVGNQMSKD